MRDIAQPENNAFSRDSQPFLCQFTQKDPLLTVIWTCVPRFLRKKLGMSMSLIWERHLGERPRDGNACPQRHVAPSGVIFYV